MEAPPQEPKDEIERLLREARTIAVVGCSPRPERDSHQIALYLRRQGYRVVPVNPNCGEILGERCYPTVREIPFPVDIVDVFRRPEHAVEAVEDAITAKAGAVWLQLGVAVEEAVDLARDAGLPVVADRCIMVEHARRIGPRQ